MNIIFRVDGGLRLGLGNVNRCIALANNLASQGMKSSFVISNTLCRDLISSHGYHVYYFNPQQNEKEVLKRIFRRKKFKVLVIDSKRKSILNILNMKKRPKVVLIDNEKLGKFADLVILPSIKELFSTNENKKLVGLDYVVLGPEFNNSFPFRHNRSILISAGGGDKYNITYDIVSSFKKKRSKFHAIVVLGIFYKHQKQISELINNDERFKIVRHPDSMTKIMSRCSMGIITFGITIYEAAKVGLPVFVISHSNENNISAKKLEKYGWSKYLGKFNMINYDRMASLIIQQNKNESFLKKMYEAGKQVDGKGVYRITKAIIAL